MRTIIKEAVPKAMSISDIINESKTDPEIIDAIKKLGNYLWRTNDSSLYYPLRWELTSVGPMLLRGNKIVVSQTLRSQILKLAHEVYDRGTIKKAMGKRKEDNRRRVVVNQIKPGDRVVVKNTAPQHKMVPTFDNRI